MTIRVSSCFDTASPIFTHAIQVLFGFLIKRLCRETFCRIKGRWCRGGGARGCSLGTAEFLLSSSNNLHRRKIGKILVFLKSCSKSCKMKSLCFFRLWFHLREKKWSLAYWRDICVFHPDVKLSQIFLWSVIYFLWGSDLCLKLVWPLYS